MTCEPIASMTSHTLDGQSWCEGEVRIEDRGGERTGDHSDRRLEQRSGPWTWRAVRLSVDEYEGGIDHGREHADYRTSYRLCAVCVVPRQSRREDDAAENHPDGHDAAESRPLPVQQPGRDRHEHNLRIRDHRAQSRTQHRDRFVPQVQVERQKQPADDRQSAFAPPTAIAGTLREPDHQ